MLVERSVVPKLMLILGAAALLALPMQAQTLSASATTITIGQVMNCNDSQTINVTSSSGSITFKAALVYASADLYHGYLYAENVATSATTIGTDGSITLTTAANSPVSLMVGLNTAIGVADSATLTLTSVGLNPVQTISIPVNFVPSLACTGLTVNNGVLTAIPASLSLTASQGQTATQTIIVTNISANTITFTAAPDPLNPWISGGGTYTLAPGQAIGIPVSASAGGLAVGTYSGVLVLGYGPGINQEFVTVSLSVVSNGVGPGITTGVKVSPSTLLFNWNPGNPTPQMKSLVITNQVGTAPIPLTFAVTQFNGPANWLITTSKANAQTGFTLGVNVNTVGLVPGVTYQGSITIMPYLGPAVEVYVGLQVAAAPVVTATPSSLTFTATQGGATPPAQTVVVTGNGTDVTYSTSAIIAGWLSANPAAGGSPNGSIPYFAPPTGGAYMYVMVNPSGLTAGTYTGTVTVYGSGPAVGNTNIAVTLIVTGPTVKGMANSASFAPAASISPGEMVTLFADPSGAFGPSTGVPLTSDRIVGNKLPTSLGGVQVMFNGVAAPLIYVSDTQINTVVPYEVAGASNVAVTVSYLGNTSGPFSVRATDLAPALFTSTSTGIGQGAAGQYDTLGNYLGMNSSANPVTRGSVITLYATGEGITKTSVTGQITAAQSIGPATPQPQMTPSVLIDGQPATVVFYGEVPGVVAGMMQLNVIVPTNAHTGQVPVSISMGSAYSQAGVTVVAQ
jgi:uncharacterized protein (TIGR03437 family)